MRNARKNAAIGIPGFTVRFETFTNHDSFSYRLQLIGSMSNGRRARVTILRDSETERSAAQFEIWSRSGLRWNEVTSLIGADFQSGTPDTVINPDIKTRSKQRRALLKVALRLTEIAEYSLQDEVATPSRYLRQLASA